MAPTPSTPCGKSGHAAVIGASIAGLLAARVLSEHFEQVTLFERDRLPPGAEARKGTPHAVHPHGLLARGRELIEGLLPGFTAALQAQGALTADLGDGLAFYADGRRFANRPIGHLGLGASRLAIEAEIRRRVLALPNVRLIDNAAVVSPVHRLGRVTGIRWTRADEADATLVQLDADWVVDCSGRGSRAPGWLRDWGYAAPKEDKVDVGLVYVSAYFERSALEAPSPTAVICAATPDLPRPAVLIAQEPDAQGRARWVAGVGGYAGDHPTPTPEGFLERARAIGEPNLIGLAESGQRLGPVMRYAYACSLRRRYERLDAFPEGFLVMGDALTSFNPIYGQGMTVAACEAAALQRLLARPQARLAQRFFAEAAKAIDIPWQLAVGNDLALPSVPGPRSWTQRLVNRYLQRLYRAAVGDAVVAVAFVRVVNLVKTPTSLFAPGIVWRVLRPQRGQAAAPARDLSRPRAAWS